MLSHIYILNLKVELLTGLYIGGNDNGFDIGGADTSVIKNPLTKEPYIPGSSLKGKLKVLLKYHEDTEKKGQDLVFKNSAIATIFDGGNDENIQVTRAIFRDLLLTEKSKSELNKKLGEGVFTEIKAENSIHPIKGTAQSPRFIERVPAGAIFEGEIVLTVFEGDQEKVMMDKIKEALRLLEYNYLGGNGTRGYGRVKIDIDDFKEVAL